MPAEPDRLEKRIRLGCGGLAGVVIGLIAAARFGPDNPAVGLGIVAVVTLFFALGALFGGDDFWLRFNRYHR